jgi:hypothetical protein
VPDGRAVIYPTGGHALVGRYEDALRMVVAFLAEQRLGKRPAIPGTGADPVQ